MAGTKLLGINILSNNGDTTLAGIYFEGIGYETIYITVTSSGAVLNVTDDYGDEQTLEYTYTGGNKFKGLALSANATTPDYIFGAHEVSYNEMTVKGTLYIVEEIGGTTITYNDSTIASIFIGDSVTLNCAGKKAKSDITVKFEQGGKILYNGNQIYAEETGLAQTVTLNCSGKKFVGDITITPTEGKALISFTIDGTTYQAESGMTWAEWVDSEYNTDGYLLDYPLNFPEGVVTHPTYASCFVYHDTEGYAYESNPISEGFSYRIYHPTGGSN